MKLRKLFAIILSLALIFSATAFKAPAQVSAAEEDYTIFSSTLGWDTWKGVLQLTPDGKINYLYNDGDEWKTSETKETDILTSTEYNDTLKIVFKVKDAADINANQWKLQQNQAFKFFAEKDGTTSPDADAILPGLENPYDGTVFEADKEYTITVSLAALKAMGAKIGENCNIFLMTGNCAYASIKLVATKTVADAPTSGGSETTENVPKTSDNALVFVIPGVMMLAAFALIASKKKTVKE